MKDIKVYYKDCRDMSELSDKSVQCCVTSPPYYGLRDYGLESLIWGGDKNCEHEWITETTSRPNQSGGLGHMQDANKGSFVVEYDDRKTKSNFCTKCNAWKGSLGLEPTPELYVQHLVEIFSEVWKKLRNDGTVWLNLGDSYAGGGGASGHTSETTNAGRKTESYGAVATGGKVPKGLKPKDMMGIPWRVAFALQADGWYLRCDNIWHKNNPMPESVNGWRWEQHRIKVNDIWKDCPGCDKCNPNNGLILRKGSWRCTKSHEYIFQLTKSAEYYGDREAVVENQKDESINRYKYSFGGNKNIQLKMTDKPTAVVGNREINLTGRNKRSVWTINTKGYKGAHFAVFPEDIPEVCIKASTSPYNCPKCGTPWARIIEKSYDNPVERNQEKQGDWESCGKSHKDGNMNSGDYPTGLKVTTLGWKPTCSCKDNDGSGKCIVLDPFAGSGTTLWVAHKLKRVAVGYELNPKYKELIDKRCHMNVRQVDDIF